MPDQVSISGTNMPADIAALRDQIIARINGRVASNPLPGSLAELQNQEDNRRLALLDALAKVQADPGYAQRADAADAASLAAGKLASNAQVAGAAGQSATATARRGLLGGSAQRADLGKIAAQGDQQQRQLATGIVDARSQGDLQRQSGLYDFLQQQILAPSALANGGASTVLNSQLATNQLNQLTAGNDAAHRSQLANTLSGVLSNTITPGISAGFNYADRSNQRQYQDWQSDYLRRGAAAGAQPTASKTWWGF